MSYARPRNDWIEISYIYINSIESLIMFRANTAGNLEKNTIAPLIKRTTREGGDSVFR